MAPDQLSQLKDIVEQYLKVLAATGISVERVILYGSYAQGTAQASSDIDLVVISADLARWRPLERLQMLSRATMHIDAPLEVIGYTPAEIQQNGADSIFWDEIVRTGMEIYRKAA